MEIILTRHNMYNFPVYVKVFDTYPGIEEIHLFSKWVFGYFGNEFVHYLEINGERFSCKRFNNFVYRNELDFRLDKDLEKFKCCPQRRAENIRN